MNRTTVQLCNNHKLAFTHTQNKKEKNKGRVVQKVALPSPLSLHLKCRERGEDESM